LSLLLSNRLVKNLWRRCRERILFFPNIGSYQRCCVCLQGFIERWDSRKTARCYWMLKWGWF